MLAIGAFALAGIAIVADPFGWLSGRTEGPRIHTIRVAYPLEHPWSLAFLPNGDMLVTERPGRLRIIRNGKLDAAWIPGVPRVVQKAQAGLMEVAIHPHFAENGFIYLTFGLSRAKRAVGRSMTAHDVPIAGSWAVINRPYRICESWRRPDR
jgi:glucose/arabinose dehydrogenase